MKLIGFSTNGLKNTEVKANTVNNVYQSREDKIEQIAFHFKKIMQTLELDLDNPSLRDTPKRVAKMYLDEAFKGLDSDKFPKVSFFIKIMVMMK